MAQKFRTGLALQPLATALFANSPFTEGKPNGYLSYRSHIWSDTDPHRTGMLPFVFEDGFGYERWVDYMLDVPMYFVFRDGKYIDAAGLSFRDFLEGKLSVLPGEKPTESDWCDHLSTAFPEVRLKSFLEMRGADGGHGVDDILAGVLGRRAADRLKHRYTLGVDIAAGGDAHAALDHRPEVGDEVAEDIVSDDHVEPLGILDHPHADGVDVGVVPLDPRVVGGTHLVEGNFVNGCSMDCGFRLSQTSKNIFCQFFLTSSDAARINHLMNIAEMSVLVFGKMVDQNLSRAETIFADVFSSKVTSF